MPKLAIAGPGGTIAPNTTPRGRVSPGNPNTSLIPRTGKVVGVAVTVGGAVDVFDGVDVGVGVSLNAKLAPVPQPASSAKVRAIGRVRVRSTAHQTPGPRSTSTVTGQPRGSIDPSDCNRRN